MLNIRNAQIEDAKALLDIYGEYVRNTAISFEYEIPTIQEFVNRMETIQERYPYFVASKLDHNGNEEILGYAYASVFKPRAAYDWSVEITIYVHVGHKGQGIGKKLLLQLEESLKKQGILNINACIAYTEEKDQHLDQTSVKFHEHMGFRKVAHFTKCGYKYHTWYDMIWMEKIVGEHLVPARDVIPYREIKEEKD